MVKLPGRYVGHPSSSSVEVKERVELYFYPPLWLFMVCYKVKFNYINEVMIIK